MPLIPCRGHERRVRLCRDYEITPVAHLKLLAGQVFESCAGGIITDSYFRFHAVRNGNPDDKGDIICGYPTGCDFCDILGVEKPRLFNPLRVENGGGYGGAGTGGVPPTPRNPVMQQLSDAVMLLLAYLPYREDSPLSSIQEKISKYPNATPFTKYIRSVNTILKNNKLTMHDVLENIERRNGPVREFDFELLKQILSESGIVSYFD